MTEINQNASTPKFSYYQPKIEMEKKNETNLPEVSANKFRKKTPHIKHSTDIPKLFELKFAFDRIFERCFVYIISRVTNCGMLYRTPEHC